MSETSRLLEREGESHEAVARASVRLCATMAACARRLDRRLLGPNEGRRREAKDDAVLGSVGGIRTGRRWGGYGYEQKQRSKEGAGKAAAKRDSGEGMITGYHISGPLLRVLRVSPFFSGDPSPSPYTTYPRCVCIFTFFRRPVPRRDAATPTSAEQPPPPSPTASARSFLFVFVLNPFSTLYSILYFVHLSFYQPVLLSCSYD